MKFDFRRLFGNLCAAGAASSLSALLIAGCASGAHVGKFWDKGDVTSSDTYAAAELGESQSVAASDDHGANTKGKVAAVAGTQDSPRGHVSLPDFADTPPEPPAGSGVSNSPTKDPSGQAAVGDASAAARPATPPRSGSTQAAADGTSGSILAPYVQKRAPSGAFDNGRHDDEIVKPKSVYAKQLDPFAATDGEPSFVRSSQPSHAALSAPAAKTAIPTVPAVAAAPAQAAPPAAKPVAIAASATPVAPPEASPSKAIELVPDVPSAPPTPPVAVASTMTRDAFDPSLPPPTQAGAEPTSGPVAIVIPAPAPVSRPRISGGSLLSPNHAGVRLGDELLDENQPSTPIADEKPAMQHAATQAAEKADPAPAATHVAQKADPVPAATQVVGKADAAPAATPYEVDLPHPPAATSPCVTTPPPVPVKSPAAPAARPVPAAPKTPQDSWETTTLAEPTTAPIQQSAPTVAPEPSDPVPAPETQTAVQQVPAPPAAAPLVTIRQAASNSSSSSSAPVSPPVKLPPQPESAPVAKVHAEEPKVSSGSDPLICDSASIHGRYLGGDVTPPVSTSQNPFDDSKEKPPAALRPMTPASPVPRAEKKSSAIEGKSTSWWDDAFKSPAAMHIVSTADFSIPAPPLPSDADESATASWTAISEPASLRPSNPQHVGRSRSRAWFVVGIAAGLAMSAVIWRRRRSGGEPQAE